jgi:hypothetical protein
VFLHALKKFVRFFAEYLGCDNGFFFGHIVMFLVLAVFRFLECPLGAS